MAKKREYERIQLLATPEIFKWWTDNDGSESRQEDLREFVRIGMKVKSGEMATVDPTQKAKYDAIETLLRTGVIASAPSEAKIEKVEEKTKKKPKVGISRQSVEAARK